MSVAEDTRYNDIHFVLAEPSDPLRHGLMGMLRSQGFRNLRCVGKIDELIEEVQAAPADLIAVSDTLGDEAFDCIRQIRHNMVGKNPFAVITIMMSPDNDSGIRRAVTSGADDVMLKPVAPGVIVDRAKKIAYHRTPFIATTEYIGPDRRKGDRKSDIPLLQVVNTLKAKLDGKSVTADMVEKAVAAGFKSIRNAQLNSHGLRLGYVCNLILKAYEANEINAELKENLASLVQCLDEASAAAKEVDQPDLEDICKRMGQQIEELAKDYREPDERSLTLIRTLTKAFEMAKNSAAARQSKKAAQAG